MSGSSRGNKGFNPTTILPDLAFGLYEELTGNNAEVVYTFEDMRIDVPNGTGEDAEHAEWRLDGTLKISTRDRD